MKRVAGATLERSEAFADRCGAPEREEGRRQCQVTAEEGSCCSEAAVGGGRRKWETVDQEVQANLNCCLGNTSGQATCHKGNVLKDTLAFKKTRERRD